MTYVGTVDCHLSSLQATVQYCTLLYEYEYCWPWCRAHMYGAWYSYEYIIVGTVLA